MKSKMRMPFPSFPISDCLGNWLLVRGHFSGICRQRGGWGGGRRSSAHRSWSRHVREDILRRRWTAGHCHGIHAGILVRQSLSQHQIGRRECLQNENGVGGIRCHFHSLVTVFVHFVTGYHIHSISNSPHFLSMFHVCYPLTLFSVYSFRVSWR